MSEFKEMRIGIKKVANGFLVGFSGNETYFEADEFIFRTHEGVFDKIKERLDELENRLCLPKPEAKVVEGDIPF